MAMMRNIKAGAMKMMILEIGLYKAGFKSKPIFLENIPLHLWHPFDPTKKKSINEEYYYKRKKEISFNNYRCEYGYDNTLGDDIYEIFNYNLEDVNITNK